MSKQHFLTIKLPSGRLIYIHDLPKGKPMVVKKAVRVDEVSLFLAESGKIYSAGKRTSSAYCTAFNSWSASKLTAVCRLGIITKQELNEILSAQKVHDKDRVRNNAKEHLRQACKTLGIKTPRIPRR